MHYGPNKTDMLAKQPIELTISLWNSRQAQLLFWETWKMERGLNLRYDTSIGAVCKTRIGLTSARGRLTSNQLNFNLNFDNNDFNIDHPFDNPVRLLHQPQLPRTVQYEYQYYKQHTEPVNKIMAAVNGFTRIYDTQP